MSGCRLAKIGLNVLEQTQQMSKKVRIRGVCVCVEASVTECRLQGKYRCECLRRSADLLRKKLGKEQAGVVSGPILKGPKLPLIE